MQSFIELALRLGAIFGAGLYVAVSPCLFPLLPLFLIRTLRAEDTRSRTVLVTSVLVLGILTSVLVFALIANLIGQFIIQHFTQLQAILGAIVVFLGIVTMSERLRKTLRLSSLSSLTSPKTPSGLLGVYVIGLSYSLLAAPCSGTTLFAVFLIFGAESNALIFILMIVLISTGVAIPYFALALATGEARNRLAMRIGESSRAIELLAGGLLVIVGLLLIIPIFGFPIGF